MIWILKRMGETPYYLRIQELVEESGISKSGIHKILQNLKKGGFVVQDMETKKYSLGPEIYRLGNVYIEKKEIYHIAYPIMKNLSELTNQTISIGTFEGGEAILAYKIESSVKNRLVGRLGTVYPINAGGIGKILHAYNSLDNLLQGEKNLFLPKLTEYTIANHNDLLNEFLNIRRDGVVISNEEHHKGLIGVASPIFDHRGKALYCICLAGSVENFRDKEIDEYKIMVKKAAKDISDILGA
jgi:IclR family KDG regulon transcriptional repressor